MYKIMISVQINKEQLAKSNCSIQRRSEEIQGWLNEFWLIAYV
ncbi:hypothetical protein [Bacillus thuringiensis]